ncbi:sporulation protein [Streptomyces poriferorum]|uniref:Sporulation protein n=1 Tax=Streptomyces poriferorum TaxID=2798799 RepID=A0ABY9IQ89_9ACTN|nr:MULTISPECIES: sporulation protein [Streptomyces]MBW5254121.1 sporulation protein [Streptomyces poriferorum]MBW5262506.1 sporulation protein [Streptomyces poriferorum]MDP5313493.1 sporulation protein [Streptomyces sp. Alt4]WLQ49783.1 sporulation protein [Streptomyces sp. Alt1]WLQ57533.1 sporulation protein [Streptomyces sp. Alt2]
MSREQRGPNDKLGTVLALAGISNAGLARRVNDLGAQRGLTLRYDKTSVARWVSKGMVPQGAAPHLIAAAIGAKLGRPVPLHEIGLADADPAPEVGLAFPRDVGEAVRSATELYRLDLAGRRAGSGGIWQSLAGSFSVSAYATPASRWLISPADPSVARASTAAVAAILGTHSGTHGTEGAQGASGAQGTSNAPGAALPPGASLPPGAPLLSGHSLSIPVQPGPDSAHAVSPLRVGHSDVSKLREAAQDARRWDSKYGGGDWRSSMVPECLRVDAAPLLLGSYSDEVGRALFGAAAELTRLAGWMAFDTGQQEAAQRYYIQALRLARAAADVPLGGYVLASMSLQATYRGFADEGVDLAQAAVERNRGLATARTMSFFRLVEARAHAKANDAPAAGSALKAAEGWLERSRDGDADPSWLGFYSYDRFAADAAECHLDLKAPRQVRRFTEQALSRPTEEFVRSHGLRLVVSAVAELESGNLDAACAAGTRAVEVAGRISSARTTEYVRDLLHRLEPYGDEPRVVELRERARPLLVAPA